MTLFREFTDPRLAAVYDALGAGFTVERLFGDWDRRPPGRAAPR